MEMTTPREKGLRNIVIVGGGGAGINIARLLSARLDPTKDNLVLISARDFHVFLPATIRLAVSPAGNLENTAFIPYDKLFSKGIGQFKLGKALAIEKSEAPGSSGGHVLLESGEHVPFSVLCLCTGADWGTSPMALPDTGVSAFVAKGRARIEVAKDIVIVGGGAVGCELAGEIQDIYGNKKKITIVHGDTSLLNASYPVKFRSALERGIRARGVDILFKEYIDRIPEEGETSVTTRNGFLLQANLVLNARGPKPNTQWISTLGLGTLTDAGLVKVYSTLQVPNHPEVFAAGDCLALPEQKQWAKAMKHAPIVAENILSFLEGFPSTKTYEGSTEMILVTNGKSGGKAFLGYLWGIVLGGFFTAYYKSAKLMVPLARECMLQQ